MQYPHAAHPFLISLNDQHPSLYSLILVLSPAQDDLVGNQASYCEYAGVDLESTYGCDCSGCDCKEGGGNVPSPTKLPSPAVYPAPTTADFSCGAGETAFTLIMKDSYGDGWNGAYFSWMDSSQDVQATGTLDYGTSKTTTLCATGDTR